MPLTIRKLFDAHLHPRQGSMLQLVAPYSARQCFGAVIMPNTTPPITTPESAFGYQEELRATVGKGFVLLMTGYLTEQMEPRLVADGFQSGAWRALKFYPRGGTTGSQHGVADLSKCYRVFETMEKIGMPLLLHGERLVHPKTGDETDPYDREVLFIEYDLLPVRDRFPGLKIVFEHITTHDAACFMRHEGNAEYLCATVTAHHLALDRRDVLRGGMNPALHCMPVIKREKHRQALRELVAEGHPFVFAGTDSAPHPTASKERCCGCAAGIFTAHCAVELYAEVFDDLGVLDKLEAFLSINGPRFYDIAPSEEGVTLAREEWRPELIASADVVLWPFGYHGNPDERHTFRFKMKVD